LKHAALVGRARRLDRWARLGGAAIALAGAGGCNAIFGVHEGELAGPTSSESTSSTGGLGGAGGGTVGTGGGGAAATGAGPCEEAFCTACADAWLSGTDDFEDGSPAPRWDAYSKPDGAIPIGEGAGYVLIDLQPGLTDGYAGYVSAQPVAFAGCAALIEVEPAAVPGGTAETYLAITQDDDTNRVFMDYAGGSLEFAVYKGGARLHDDALTFDPVAHRWWRVREEGGKCFGGVSSNGTVWHDVFEADCPTSFDAAYVGFGAGTYVPSADDPGETRFDDFNRPPGG
jgi:hypothetical protein